MNDNNNITVCNTVHRNIAVFVRIWAVRASLDSPPQSRRRRSGRPVRRKRSGGVGGRQMPNNTFDFTARDRSTHIKGVAAALMWPRRREPTGLVACQPAGPTPPALHRFRSPARTAGKTGARESLGLDSLERRNGVDGGIVACVNVLYYTDDSGMRRRCTTGPYQSSLSAIITAQMWNRKRRALAAEFSDFCWWTLTCEYERKSVWLFAILRLVRKGILN